MEKKDIKIDYTNSGVKTLNGFGTFFIMIGFIAILVALIMFSVGVNIVFSLSILISSIGSFLGGSICKGLSGIARSALYRRLVLEQEYYFIGE